MRHIFWSHRGGAGRDRDSICCGYRLVVDDAGQVVRHGFAPLPAALDRRGDRRKPLHPRRAYVYAVREHGRHMAMDRLAKDEACHVAAHFAKLPELLKRPPQ